MWLGKESSLKLGNDNEKREREEVLLDIFLRHD